MSTAILFAILFAAQSQTGREDRVHQLILEITRSGRVLEIGEAPRRLEDPQKLVPPGIPPLLSFRYFQGADRHRFGKLDLMLDDAGH